MGLMDIPKKHGLTKMGPTGRKAYYLKLFQARASSLTDTLLGLSVAAPLLEYEISQRTC